ncbi:MAG: purine-binding chemotaxis protein CheW [Candidatus Latescibacteria bacterium]|nr:purine-binding chemotaxis protein CheW [Candidatus Latescibacterota bacterium]
MTDLLSTAEPQAENSLGFAGGPQEADLIQVIGLEVTNERFIIDILHVREIVRFSELEITRVPHSHLYILGVVNLRGKVVPVVDLATRLGLQSQGRSRQSRLVVVDIADRLMGFTVDAVSEVLRLSQEQIEPSANTEEYVAGTATVNHQIMTLLDLGKLLANAQE